MPDYVFAGTAQRGQIHGLLNTFYSVAYSDSAVSDEVRYRSKSITNTPPIL